MGALVAERREPWGRLLGIWDGYCRGYGAVIGLARFSEVSGDDRDDAFVALKGAPCCECLPSSRRRAFLGRGNFSV